MIRFVGTRSDGGKLIGLALSRANCEKLLEHKPIELDLQKDLDLNWQGSILLLAGETEKSLADELAPMIDPEAKMNVDDNPYQEDLARLDLGATGKYPDGKHNNADEGEIKMAIAADIAKNVVVIQFGKSIAWLGLRPQDAIQLASKLVHHAKKCATAQQRIILPGNGN